MTTTPAPAPNPTQQLRMVWPKTLLEQPPAVTVPEGYRLRTYRPGDEPSFFHVMSLAGFENWDMAKVLPWLQKILPRVGFWPSIAPAINWWPQPWRSTIPTNIIPLAASWAGWPAIRIMPDSGLGGVVCAAVTTRLNTRRLYQHLPEYG